RLHQDTAGEPLKGEKEALERMGAEIVTLEPKSSISARISELLRLYRIANAFSPDVLWGSGTSWHMGLLGAMLGRRVRRVFFEGMSGEVKGLFDPRWIVRGVFDEVVGQSPRVSETFSKCTGWKGKLAAIPAYPEPLEITARLPNVARRTISFGNIRAAFFSRLVEGKQASWLVR